jgi:hypothetical protein
MNVKVQNNTTHDDEDVRRLVAFATKDINVTDVVVTVDDKTLNPHLKGYGRARRTASLPPGGSQYAIDLYLPDQAYPIDNRIKKVKWLPIDIDEDQAIGLMRLDLYGVAVTYRWKKWAIKQYGIVRQHGYGGIHTPLIVVRNWREFLVWVAAHEARHIHQMRHGKRLSEVDCEKWAFRKVNDYEWFCRTHKGETIP